MANLNWYGAENDTLKWHFEYAWMFLLPGTVEPRYNEVGYNKILL